MVILADASGSVFSCLCVSAVVSFNIRQTWYFTHAIELSCHWALHKRVKLSGLGRLFTALMRAFKAWLVVQELDVLFFKGFLLDEGRLNFREVNILGRVLLGVLVYLTATSSKTFWRVAPTLRLWRAFTNAAIPWRRRTWRTTPPFTVIAAIWGASTRRTWRSRSAIFWRTGVKLIPVFAQAFQVSLFKPLL